MHVDNKGYSFSNTPENQSDPKPTGDLEKKIQGVVTNSPASETTSDKIHTFTNFLTEKLTNLAYIIRSTFYLIVEGKTENPIEIPTTEIPATREFQALREEKRNQMNVVLNGRLIPEYPKPTGFSNLDALLPNFKLDISEPIHVSPKQALRESISGGQDSNGRHFYTIHAIDNTTGIRHTQTFYERDLETTVWKVQGSNIIELNGESFIDEDGMFDPSWENLSELVKSGQLGKWQLVDSKYKTT